MVANIRRWDVESEYLTVAEIAAKLKVNRDNERRLFIDEPGVIRIGMSGRRKTRDYITMRIPVSVFGELSGGTALRTA